MWTNWIGIGIDHFVVYIWIKFFDKAKFIEYTRKYNNNNNNKYTLNHSL
jgi:hypothetical protein